MPPQIDFYFHAGQTNWYGSHADENLIDAVLLGARRIANAYAITKHPLVMGLVKRFGIAIEMSPVGNQVLQMGTDYRNHPAATMIANDIPFVLSSGIPSFCRTKPLSHDFYISFLGIAVGYTIYICDTHVYHINIYTICIYIYFLCSSAAQERRLEVPKAYCQEFDQVQFSWRCCQGECNREVEKELDTVDRMDHRE